MMSLHNRLMPYMVALYFKEPLKSRAPQLHLEYRFYKALGQSGYIDYSIDFFIFFPAFMKLLKEVPTRKTFFKTSKIDVRY